MKYPTWTYRNYKKWRVFENSNISEGEIKFGYESVQNHLIYTFREYKKMLEDESHHDKEQRLDKFNDWLFCFKIDKLLK